jgi:hypothetical protein
MMHFLVLTILCITSIIGARSITHQEAITIGKKIWQNECSGKIEGLTSWNQGEEFASLGIGHFIWCPQRTKKACPFSETFPSLLTFMQKHGRRLPIGLKTTSGCPWSSRKAFLRNFNSKRMIELRTFLKDTIDLQIAFMLERLEKVMPTLAKTARPALCAHVQKQFKRLEATAAGRYVLVDYLNFKGDGASVKERYHNQGWGLLQVLEHMKGTSPATAVQEFVIIAKHLLAKRVAHAPRERNEQRWIPGWNNRLDTYLAFNP